MLEQRISDLIALTAALKDCEDWEEYLDEVVQATEQLKTYLKTVKRPAMPQGALPYNVRVLMVLKLVPQCSASVQGA